MQNLVKLCAMALLWVASSGHVSASTLRYQGEVIGWTDDSGTDWLRLDNVALDGLSLAEYQAGLTAYGQTWELATRSDIAALWAEFEPLAASGSYADTQAPYTQALGARELIRNAFGHTFHTNTGGTRSATQGYSADGHYDVNGVLLWQYAPRVFIEFEGTIGSTSYWAEIWSTNNASIGSGTAWMQAVSVATVPLPATLPLYFLAIGLVAIPKRRRPAKT